MLFLSFYILLQCYGILCGKIQVNTYRIISPAKMDHNFQNILDDELETAADIFIQSSEDFSVAFELQEEHLIESILITADTTNETIHQIHVGYLEPTTQRSLPFKCEHLNSVEFCHFPCVNGNLSLPVLGTHIFWTLRQIGQGSWARIYEVSFEGTPVKSQNIDQNSLVSIAWRKPFIIKKLLPTDEKYCREQYWQIVDSSLPRRVFKVPETMVVYFGRNYIIKELQITIPSNDNLECQLRFGSFEVRNLTINVRSDCKPIDDHDGYMQFSCKPQSLDNLPFNQVEFSTDEINKLKILGVPIQYPTLTLSTSEATNSEGSPVFDVVCTAVPCAESCDSLGEVATCDGLMLLRQPLHGGASSVVIHHGQLRPLWSELLQDLTITVNQDSRMVARIPRKAVFRRNYSVAYLGGRQELKDGTSGVIVLSTSGNGGYFQMAARALTLAFTLQTKVEWVEDGQPKSSEASHPQEDVVRLFPDVEALANYTITASSVVPNDVYPDIRDGETVTYHWGFPGQPSSVVTDVFRIVDADKEPSEFVRAWVVSKTDSLLHILVFCQHSNSTSTFNNEVSVELLSYGCGPDEEPNLSATFGLNGQHVNLPRRGLI
uniref:Ig-like domain-containing protein n=1 Tax=Mesocestoides corti TaxID=53468 RepID=A0A5K3EK50_MESCO